MTLEIKPPAPLSRGAGGEGGRRCGAGAAGDSTARGDAGAPLRGWSRGRDVPRPPKRCCCGRWLRQRRVEGRCLWHMRVRPVARHAHPTPRHVPHCAAHPMRTPLHTSCALHPMHTPSRTPCTPWAPHRPHACPVMHPMHSRPHAHPIDPIAHLACPTPRARPVMHPMHSRPSTHPVRTP